MIVTTLQHYQARAGKGEPQDAGYWDRVYEWLRSEAAPEGWDEQGQPLYSLDDLLHAECAAKARLH